MTNNTTTSDKKLLLFFMATAPEQEYTKFQEHFNYTQEDIDIIEKSRGGVMVCPKAKFSKEELKIKYAEYMLKTWKEYESLLNENN